MQGDSLPDKIRYMESQRTKMGRSRRSKDWWSPGQEGDRVATADLEDVTWADLSIGRPMIPSESRGASGCGLFSTWRTKGEAFVQEWTSSGLWWWWILTYTPVRPCVFQILCATRRVCHLFLVECVICTVLPPPARRLHALLPSILKLTKTYFFINL